MQRRTGYWFRPLLVGLLLATLALSGCGDDGSDGATGATGPEGPAGPVTTTAETCAICHTGGNPLNFADISVAHPLLLEKPVVSDIVVARSAADVLTVTFHVADTAGLGLAGITDTPGNVGNIRVYMADIVPAGTVTANLPQSTWDTAFLERWADEHGDDVGVTVTDLGGGDYSFVMAATPADIGGVRAPEGDLLHTQRIYVRADARDIVGFDRTIGVADFTMPLAGAATAILVNGATTRTIVDASACTACHNDPLQNAAHGAGYQSPQVCNMCHSPIGTDYGDMMQADEAWLASLIHKIHAQIDMPAFPTRINGGGYSNVTYPKNIKNCEVCHFDNGQDMASAWNTHPTAEVCTTCHTDSTLSVNATTGTGEITHTAANPLAPAGTYGNGACTGCHPDTAIIGYHTVTTLKAPDKNGNPVSITPAFDTTITMTAPANGTFYVAGETPVVTATTTATGDYTSLDNTVDYTAATVYVYGPRAFAVPVLTPSSTTDANWDPAIAPADQGRDMRASAAAADANVLTDPAGFKYQLQAIPADLAAGTYMVQVAIGHTSSRITGSRNYKIDGWQLITFQVGTATESLKVAGDGCANCHTQEDWGTMYHRSYFGTDGCIACHDKSGNHANFLANRVHAVHAATVNGDLLGYDWSAITFPQDISTCQACHTADDQYRTEPTLYSAACIGCHGDTPLVEDHMIQNGATVFGAAN